MGLYASSRHALCISVAAALFAGCGGSSPPIGASIGDSAEMPGHFIYASGTCIDFRAEVFVTGPGCSRSEMPESVPAGSSGRFLDLAPRSSREALTVAPRTIRSPDYKMSKSLLYVTNPPTSTYRSALGDVMVYSAKDRDRIAIITDGIDQPGFDCIDATGTLYVPQNGSIVEYAAGQITPLRYITQGSGTPADCTIDAKGNLWVAALSDVIEYLKGSTQPHKTITDGVSNANSVVFDHHGNMYVGNNLGPYSQQSFIGVYRPGRNTPSRAITNGLFYPEGLAVDSDDTLYVANAIASGSACGNIEEYRFGQSKPFQAITDEINGPTGLAFANGRLYEDNGGINECKSNFPLVLEFSLGSIKPSKNTISIFRDPIGLAYYPPALP
jgi:hypothetical protein